MSAFDPPGDLAAAAQLQRELAGRVRLEGTLDDIETVTVLDASHKPGEPMVAAAVVWDLGADRVTEVGLAAHAETELFPYLSGYLSFREAPAYLAALAELGAAPELLLVDGQGVAHPRGLGIAAHLGVHLECPSIGVAKRPLYGRAAGELPEAKGGAVALVAKGTQVGWVYRSRERVKPLYVSPGHLVSMESALELVRGLPGRTKLPDPLRAAHDWAGRARREGLRGRVTP